MYTKESGKLRRSVQKDTEWGRQFLRRIRTELHDAGNRIGDNAFAPDDDLTDEQLALRKLQQATDALQQLQNRLRTTRRTGARK